MRKHYKNINKKLVHRKSFTKSLSIMAMIGVLIANTTVGVMAKESNDKDIEPLGINGANDIKSSSENKESSDNKKLGNVNPSYQKKYTFKELNSLSYSDLIKTIKSISYSDVPELFKFTEDSYEFYKDENRVQALIDELYRIGQTYTKDDNQGIQTVVEFLRSAFYLGYYNEELKYLNTKEFQSRCIPAIEAIENNENFALGTRVQDEVVDSLGKFIANTVCTPEIVNGVTKIFHQYERNLEVYSKERSKGSAIYQLMNGIDYQIYTDLYHNDPKDTIFYGKIDGYIEEIEKLALLGNRANSDNMWLVDNALYFIGKIGNLRNDPRISQKVLTDAMMIYPYLSTQYFEAATRLSENFGGKNSNGQTIDMDAIKEAGKGKYLSKNYEFDNGAFVVKAGDKVTEEKVKRLYWAAKEVKAQYHRVVGNDKPLEAGNPDDVLTVVVYNSPEEYKMNAKLYGYDTDNGGIYIEGIGTFFTYERKTPEESVYTLEELFRHEYTHYLQGRYVVPGIWGQGDFYKDNELTWYEEGTAEFFAGSTRTGGILPRKSVTGYLAHDEERRLSLPELLYSKYGSWDFYHYGFAFSNYMYNKDIDMLQRMTNYIKDNKVEDYKEYIKTLSNNSSLNEEYQRYMDSLLGNYDNLTVPLVSDEYLKTHPYKNNNEIVSEIDSVLDLNNITTDINESSYFNTVSIKGTFVGGKSVDEDDDWKDMNKKLDEVLKKLEENSWSGYKTLTAYFTNYKVNSDGNYEFEVNFHGISTDSSVENKAPVINAELDSLGVVNEGIKFNGEKSQDEDGTIKEYLWDFGDGTTSKEVKGIHKYEKEGVYKVKLKVTDDKGAQSEKTFEIRIAKEESSCRTIESEPNDSFNNANGGVFSGEAISASFTKGDSSDIFYFDVEKEGEVTIDVKNPNNLGVNWLLFKEGDLNNYISYASKEGDSLINKVNLSPGRYYVNIYSYDRNKLGDYTLTITGGLKTSSENGFVDEVENNNNFDEAMKITKNKGISAYIDDKDAVDIYTFTLDKPLDIEILLEKQNHMKLNWILYHESDLNNYVSYANIEGNTLKNTYKAKPGKYYIGVYKYDKNTEGAYTLKLGSALE